MLCGAEGCDLPTKSLWARRCVVPHTCRAYSTSCARARPVTICTRYPGIIGLAVSSETEDSPDSTPPARPLRSMQTGQNSIAPENSLPQLGQVRWGSMLMILTALQPTEKARSHERPETPAARRLAYLLSRCTSNRDSRDRWRNMTKNRVILCSRCLLRCRIRLSCLNCKLCCQGPDVTVVGTATVQQNRHTLPMEI